MHNVILEDDGIHTIAEKLKTIRMTLEQSLRDEGLEGSKRSKDPYADLRKKKGKTVRSKTVKDLILINKNTKRHD